MKTVILNDGREVDSNSPEWRDETMVRHGQVQELLGMRGVANRPKRQQFIDQVEFLEGALAGERLRAALQKAWTEGADA
jgi:hypothetical protein